MRTIVKMPSGNQRRLINSSKASPKKKATSMFKGFSMPISCSRLTTTTLAQSGQCRTTQISRTERSPFQNPKTTHQAQTSIPMCLQGLRTVITANMAPRSMTLKMPLLGDSSAIRACLMASKPSPAQHTIRSIHVSGTLCHRWDLPIPQIIQPSPSQTALIRRTGPHILCHRQASQPETSWIQQPQETWLLHPQSFHRIPSSEHADVGANLPLHQEPQMLQESRNRALGARRHSTHQKIQTGCAALDAMTNT